MNNAVILQASADGRELYRQACMRCHQADPPAFSTPADQIASLLRANNIRQHRFDLSDSEINAITTYLSQFGNRP